MLSTYTVVLSYQLNTLQPQNQYEAHEDMNLIYWNDLRQ